MLASRPLVWRFPLLQLTGQLGSFYYASHTRSGIPLNQKQYPDRSTLPSQAEAFGRYQAHRGFDPNKRYALASSKRVPY